jgi:hypothetical protein
MFIVLGRVVSDSYCETKTGSNLVGGRYLFARHNTSIRVLTTCVSFLQDAYVLLKQLRNLLV